MQILYIASNKRRLSSHVTSQSPVIRRRPVSAAAVVLSSTNCPTPSRRPVVIHGGKERPPAPKLINITNPRPQSIAAHPMYPSTPVPSNNSHHPLPKLTQPQRRRNEAEHVHTSTNSAATQTTLSLKKAQATLAKHTSVPSNVVAVKSQIVGVTPTGTKTGTSSTAANSRFFTEDVSVSESTDITDVTAKSQSINSYSTSMQAEVGSHHFSSSINPVTAAAINTYRFQKNLLDAAHRPRPESVFSQLIKNSLAKNHIKIQYGPVTTAESINHLEPYKIDFLKQTTYLQDLRPVFPKISVNLNETSKRIYIFGAANQVNDCKQKIKDELARLGHKEFRLENREVASYLVEKDIKERILKHIYSYLKRSTKSPPNYGHLNPDMEADSRQSGDHKRHLYVNYDVIDHSSRNPKDLGEYSLIVYTNYDKAYEAIFNYLSESIYVDYELKIKMDDFAHAVMSNEPQWTDFYRKMAANGKYVVYRVDSKKSRKRHRNLRWYLKLTGYKNSCEEFLTELVKYFGNVFE